jgi:hypothetical protein
MATHSTFESLDDLKSSPKIKGFRGRSSSVINFKFDALALKNQDTSNVSSNNLNYNTTQQQKQGKTFLQRRSQISSISLGKGGAGNNRKNIHFKALSSILRNYMFDLSKTSKQDAIIDPNVVNDIPFKSILLPRHKGSPYVYKAYSVVLNERIGEFNVDKIHQWLDDITTESRNSAVNSSSYLSFIDELLTIPECLSFLDEYWRVICSIPIGGRLPQSTNYQSYCNFHEVLGIAFPNHRGSDFRSAGTDWLENTTSAVPEGWSTTITDEKDKTEGKGGGKEGKESYSSKTGNANNNIMNVGEGGLEWLKSSFEKQILILIVEILCDSTRNSMRVLKGLRSLFEHIYPKLKIEIKRKKKKRRSDSIMLVDNKELFHKTTSQRTFGREKFIVVGIPHLDDDKSSKHNIDSNNKNHEIMLETMKNKNKFSVEFNSDKRNQEKGKDQKIIIKKTTSMAGRERRRSSSRRQSMFGALLFDFVIRQQNEKETESQNRRPHLASLTHLEEPLRSPGRSSSNGLTPSTSPSHHYDNRKTQSVTSAPNSPNVRGSTGRALLSRSSSTSMLKPVRQRRSSLQLLTRSSSPSDSRNSFMDELRLQYDPTGEGQKNGSSDLYSDKALLQREALRFDKDVLYELNKIWKLVDADNNGAIDFNEFCVMHHKLFVLYHGHLNINDRPSTDEENIIRKEDWEKDVVPLRNYNFNTNTMLDNDPKNSITLNKDGLPIMTRKHFINSWFHMADMWTDQISSELYTTFLKFTLNKIAFVNPNGILEWRSDESICDLMIEHYMTDEEREAKRKSLQEKEEERQQQQQQLLQEDQLNHDVMIKSSSGMKVGANSSNSNTSNDDTDIDQSFKKNGQQKTTLNSMKEKTNNYVVTNSDTIINANMNEKLNLARDHLSHLQFQQQDKLLQFTEKKLEKKIQLQHYDGMIDGSIEWLGQTMKRKGPRGNVALYSNKPTHVLIRARMSEPPIFGSSNPNANFDERKIMVEEKYKYLNEKKRIANEKREQLSKKRAEERRKLNEKRKRNRPSSNNRHKSQYSTRPHRLLGSVPGIKRPFSPLLRGTPDLKSLCYRQDEAISYFQSLEGTTNKKNKSLIWHNDEDNGRMKFRRSHSAGRYRSPESTNNQRHLTSGPSHLYYSENSKSPPTEPPSVSSLILQKNKKKNKKKNSYKKRPNTASLISRRTRNKTPDDETFAMSGYAERGVALRREEHEDALVRVTAMVSNSVEGCFGGPDNRKFEKMNIQMCQNSKNIKNNSNRQISRLHNKIVSGDNCISQRPQTAGIIRKNSLKNELLLLNRRKNISMKRRRKGKRKKERSNITVELSTDTVKNSFAIPSVSPVSQNRKGSRTRLASAGRDRKTKALFDRYFKISDGTDKLTSSFNNNKSNSSSSNNNNGNNSTEPSRSLNLEEEKEDAIDWSQSIPVPGVVIIKKPNWSQYLVR